MPAYFVLDTGHADYAGLIAACTAAHEQNAPGCLLSVFLNTSGTRALVKVAGVSKDWLNSAAVLDTASKAEHQKILDMCYGDSMSGWVAPDTKDGGGANASHSDSIDGGAV